MSDCILYHSLCLAVLISTYFGSRGSKKELAHSIEWVYITSALIILTDLGWRIFSYFGADSISLSYLINMVYFLSETIGVYSWLKFSLETMDISLRKGSLRSILVEIPAIAVALLIFTTSFTGFVFTIEDGQYVRGKLFFIISAAQLGYLFASSALSLHCAAKEHRRYLRKQYILFSVYSIPVMIFGILQAATGLDFNCIAPVVGLAVVYRYGLINEGKDNADLVRAIAQPYETAFIINTDDHSIRVIRAKGEFRKLISDAETGGYEECCRKNIQNNVVPEDKLAVEKAFELENIIKRLDEKNAYSIFFKVKTGDGHSESRKATFIKAFSKLDRREVFLGIEAIETRQLLMQQKEALEEEKENFEKVKEAFTSVMANVIEARDVDSGEHVMRVKSITQLLCSQVMDDYPEYGLTPVKIRYIVNGSALHDIGKIMISDSILLKPGRLTDEEFCEMKTHCVKGCTILDKLPADLDEDYLMYSREICRWHHEKYDGKGYPDGLAGDQIPISAQIVSLADCFDALTSKRVYKDAFSKEKAFEMIVSGQCGSFNAKLLQCFAKIYGKIEV